MTTEARQRACHIKAADRFIFDRRDFRAASSNVAILMTKSTISIGFIAMAFLFPARAEELHTFKRLQLNDQFWSEGASFGDLNKDGVNDLKDSNDHPSDKPDLK